MTGRRLRVMGSGQSLIHHDLRGGGLAGFTALCERLRGADVAFTNFEASLAVEGKASAGPVWRDVPVRPSGPETLECLAWMGFNLVSLANNHSCEGGADGLLLTKRVSTGLGRGVAGADGLEAGIRTGHGGSGGDDGFYARNAAGIGGGGLPGSPDFPWIGEFHLPRPGGYPGLGNG